MADARLLAQPKPVILRHVVEIVDLETEEAVQSFDVAGHSDRQVERIIRGLAAQIDGKRFRWREVREIDEARWRSDLAAVNGAGMRFENPRGGMWTDARGEEVEPFADEVPWPERQISDLLRWGYITEAQAESARS
jgi:hypothetical protein